MVILNTGLLFGVIVVIAIGVASGKMTWAEGGGVVATVVAAFIAASQVATGITKGIEALGPKR